MLNETRRALASQLSGAGHERAVEVGVGDRPDVAAELAACGLRVTATDVREREVPTGVGFAVEDVTDPDPVRYREADVVYALNCPPELQRPLREAARIGDAACYFTTLGTDPAVVPATTVTLPGETLFRVRMHGPGSGEQRTASRRGDRA